MGFWLDCADSARYHATTPGALRQHGHTGRRAKMPRTDMSGAPTETTLHAMIRYRKSQLTDGAGAATLAWPALHGPGDFRWRARPRVKAERRHEPTADYASRARWRPRAQEFPAYFAHAYIDAARRRAFFLSAELRDVAARRRKPTPCHLY